jgi:hypothetical protein
LEVGENERARAASFISTPRALIIRTLVPDIPVQSTAVRTQMTNGGWVVRVCRTDWAAARAADPAEACSATTCGSDATCPACTQNGKNKSGQHDATQSPLRYNKVLMLCFRRPSFVPFWTSHEQPYALY